MVDWDDWILIGALVKELEKMELKTTFLFFTSKTKYRRYSKALEMNAS